jgi:hypothetical protein
VVESAVGVDQAGSVYSAVGTRYEPDDVVAAIVDRSAEHDVRRADEGPSGLAVVRSVHSEVGEGDVDFATTDACSSFQACHCDVAGKVSHTFSSV